jgi:hypothetical protein
MQPWRAPCGACAGWTQPTLERGDGAGDSQRRLRGPVACGADSPRPRPERDDDDAGSRQRSRAPCADGDSTSRDACGDWPLRWRAIDDADVDCCAPCGAADSQRLLPVRACDGDSLRPLRGPCGADADWRARRDERRAASGRANASGWRGRGAWGSPARDGAGWPQPWPYDASWISPWEVS